MRRIPFFRQLNEHYCGPAILQMVLASHGIQKSQRTLAQKAHTPLDPDHGTTIKNLLSVLRHEGLRIQAGQRQTVRDLKVGLQNGSIVIICYTERSWGWGHYSIVKNITKDRVFLLDPDTRTGNVSFRIDEFKRRWKDPTHTRTVRWAAFVKK